MKARSEAFLASVCLVLAALVEVTLLRRHHAMSQFLTSPIKHHDPYRIGQGTAWLAAGLLLLLGCAGVAATTFASHRADRLRLTAACVAIVSVLALVWVQPFNSAAFVTDRRHDVGVAALLLCGALGALIVIVWRALAELRRAPSR